VFFALISNKAGPVSTKSIADTLKVRVPRRVTKQDRSAIRQKRITEGAIVAISRHGIAGLTHRRVAHEAHVSLAATTYYYQTKTDIIADASRALLTHYVEAFRRFAGRHSEQADKIAFCDFAMKLVFNAAGKHSVESLAWCEIILNTARQPELRGLSQTWFKALNEVWREIASLLGARDTDHAVTSAIDTVIGFLFTIVPLGLPESGLRNLMAREAGRLPAKLFKTAQPKAAPVRTSKKAEETRERILNAAVEILITEGADALTFRYVAEKTGLTLAAPTYYFSSMSTLWNAAQLRLFDESKVRYRSVMGTVDYATLDVTHLVDLTSTVFLREATEFRNLSMATYPVYLQSRRDASLRPGLWAIDAELQRRWFQVMTTVIPGSTPASAWLMHALFTGKLIRILATGAETRALARVRSEFAYDLIALAKGRHWSTLR
jgi:DNA-binding transcriptional regulator YbjK